MGFGGGEGGDPGGRAVEGDFVLLSDASGTGCGRAHASQGRAARVWGALCGRDGADWEPTCASRSATAERPWRREGRPGAGNGRHALGLSITAIVHVQSGTRAAGCLTRLHEGRPVVGWGRWLAARDGIRPLRIASVVLAFLPVLIPFCFCRNKKAPLSSPERSWRKLHL